MRLSPWLAKLLLTKGPHAAWQAAENKRLGLVTKRTKATRLGSCVDRLVFGVGEEITRVARHRGTPPVLGLIHVTDAELVHAKAIANAVELAWPGCRTGHVQTKLVWADPEYGHACSTMPDHIDPAGHIDTDLKTAWSLSDHELRRQISKFGYDMAAVAGLDALKVLYGWGDASFRWLFVETVEPYEVRIIGLDPVQRAAGLLKWREANRIWAKCLADNDWPDIVPVQAPVLSYKQQNDPINYITGE